MACTLPLDSLEAAASMLEHTAEKLAMLYHARHMQIPSSSQAGAPNL